VSNLYIFGSKAYINVPKVERPKGYIESGDEDLVCRLHKCLYGLKQAPRVWNNHFDDFLKRVGLKPSESDPCPYLRHQEDEFTMVIIWVYNALICSSSSETIDEIISEKKARSTSLNLITSRKYFAVIRWTNLIQYYHPQSHLGLSTQKVKKSRKQSRFRFEKQLADSFTKPLPNPRFF
jgi:histone deacetylase 1/2